MDETPSQYGYDSGAITPFTGATNHDDANYSASNTLRGNVTSVGRWLNTTGTFLTTNNVYNQVGNLVQTTDPGGHTYNLYYDDNYADGLDRKSQAFLTHVTSPTTSNGVSHVEGKQYYWPKGLTAAVCGQNAPNPAACTNTLSPSAGSPVADYAKYTYDIMNRPLTVTHGDGGVTNFTFNESSFPFTVSSSSQIDSAQNLVNTALIDGLGRVKQTQLNSDPDGVDFVDTTYDPAGQKATVSNPHRSTSASTDGITTYQYDALGRTNLVIPPDGTATSNNVSTSYSGNKVTVTDQAGKQRRSVTDALGRLIEVDEPSAPAGATSSNGYATISGTELWGGGASAHGTVTIGGHEQSGTGDPPCTLYDDGGNCIQWGSAPTYYDQGFVSITVNGHTDTLGYNQTSTSVNIAANLVTVINADSSAPVSATASGAVITLTTRVHTAATMSLSATTWSTDTSGYILFQSFTATASPSTLTGGANDWADTGTLTLTVGGVQNQVTYGSSSTASLLASALASGVNGNSSSPVTASASGSTINFTDKAQGSALALSLGVVSNYPSTFVPISFSSAVSDEYLNNFATTPAGSLLTPMVTLYMYDALDNLTCVEQHGTATGQTGCASSPSNDATSAWRIRRFTYDSLGRLVTAKNPESGTISYTYDSDGNVLTKYDARGITTTMTYDQLHRVLTKTYSDGTPTVTMAYDGGNISGCSPTLTITNGVGRRTAMCDGAGWESWAYDSHGHVTTDRRNTNNVTKDTTYAYNFAGNETSVTYPSGHIVTYTYNTVAKLGSASDVASSVNYATNAHYAPSGALAFLQIGSGINSTYIFNKRLQPCWMSSTHGAPAIGWNTTQCTDTASAGNILDYKYNFSLGSADNGDVVSITNNITPARSQSFTYDELNRLSTAATQANTGTYAWGLSFGYDAWGNLLTESVTQGSALALSVSIDPIHYTNRVSGYSYDAAGNMLNDASNTYTFDAENRISTTAGVTYAYDGDGNRVKKSNGKLYWFGGGADALDETDATGNTNNSTFNEYIFFGGKRIARRDSSSNMAYYFADELGSSRVVTNSLGILQDDSDFYPFGGERSYLSSSGNAYKFTGKERDAESGLDDFGARYYSSALGRFISVDPSRLSIKPEDPQTWNRYLYARDNPLDYTDPNGMWARAEHEMIIDRVFRFLDDGDRSYLKEASLDVDDDQSMGGSYKHGMRALGQTPEEARGLGEQFITEHLNNAVNAQLDWENHGLSGESSRALYEFGIALHTTTDAASPWHGNWTQAWGGWWDPLGSAAHAVFEYSLGGRQERDLGMAEYQANLLWTRYQKMLNDERKKREEAERKKKEEEKKKQEKEKEEKDKSGG